MGICNMTLLTLCGVLVGGMK